MFALDLLRGARQLSLGTFRSGAFDGTTTDGNVEITWLRPLGCTRVLGWQA